MNRRLLMGHGLKPSLLGSLESLTVLKGTLALLVVGSMLAIGCVHPPSMLVAGLLSTVVLCQALWLQSGRRSRRIPVPALVLFSLAAFTLLQLIPLPLGWLEVIAPENADVWTRSLMPLGEAPPSSVPLSLDPGASWIEVLRWFSYGAVFVAAGSIGAREGAAWGVLLVFVAALLSALTTIGHGLLEATRVWGLYEPSFTPTSWQVGPLLNPNNQSGYLNLGAMCGIGLLLKREPIIPRSVVMVGVAVLLGVNATTASRGGLLFLLVGVLAIGATMELSRRRWALSAHSLRLNRWMLGLSLIAGLGLAGLGTPGKVWHELYDQNVEKLTMVQWVKPAVADFPYFGMGRGAFESVYPAYQQGTGQKVYTHAENFVAQWVVEWGIVVAVLALLILMWQLRPGRLGVGRSAVVAAGWFGVVVVALQNLLDLAFEVPAVCFALMVVLGSIFGDHKRVSSTAGSRRRRTGRRRWPPVALAAALGITLIAVAWHNGLNDVVSDRESLHAALGREKPPRSRPLRDELSAMIRERIRRHPAEPYFPFMGGQLAWEERHESPMPWLQRALERWPGNGKAHLLCAKVVYAHSSRAQGLMMLRLAVESDSSQVTPAARLAARWARSMAEVLTAVPAGSAGAASLDALGYELTLLGRRELSTLCDREALKRDPSRVLPHERLAADIIARVKQGDCPDLKPCEAELSEHIDALAVAEPEQSAPLRLRARWLCARGRAEEAEQLLAEHCEKMEDHHRCLRERVIAASEISDPMRLAEAAKPFARSCSGNEQCAAAEELLGDLHLRRKELLDAVAHYRRATRDAPNEQRWRKLGEAASQAGLHAEAAYAFERLKRALGARGERDPAQEERIRIEREKATGRMLEP